MGPLGPLVQTSVQRRDNFKAKPCYSDSCLIKSEKPPRMDIAQPFWACFSSSPLWRNFSLYLTRIFLAATCDYWVFIDLLWEKLQTRCLEATWVCQQVTGLISKCSAAWAQVLLLAGPALALCGTALSHLVLPLILSLPGYLLHICDCPWKTKTYLEWEALIIAWFK